MTSLQITKHATGNSILRFLKVATFVIFPISAFQYMLTGISGQFFPLRFWSLVLVCFVISLAPAAIWCSNIRHAKKLAILGSIVSQFLVTGFFLRNCIRIEKKYLEAVASCLLTEKAQTNSYPVNFDISKCGQKLSDYSEFWWIIVKLDSVSKTSKYGTIQHLPSIGGAYSSYSFDEAYNHPKLLFGYRDLIYVWDFYAMTWKVGG